MPGAGDLKERVAFASRIEVRDEYGGSEGAWETHFERPAMFIMRPGSEQITGARLEGRQPVIIVVRYDSETREIGTDWQLTDVRTTKTYAVRAVEDMDRKRQWITLICEGGGLA